MLRRVFLGDGQLAALSSQHFRSDLVYDLLSFAVSAAVSRDFGLPFCRLGARFVTAFAHALDQLLDLSDFFGSEVFVVDLLLMDRIANRVLV